MPYPIDQINIANANVEKTQQNQNTQHCYHPTKNSQGSSVSKSKCPAQTEQNRASFFELRLQSNCAIILNFGGFLGKSNRLRQIVTE